MAIATKEELQKQITDGKAAGKDVSELEKQLAALSKPKRPQQTFLDECAG